MTSRDAAIMLGMARQSVHRRIVQGGFRSARTIGEAEAAYVIRRSEVEAMVSGKHEDYVEKPECE